MSKTQVKFFKSGDFYHLEREINEYLATTEAEIQFKSLEFKTYCDKRTDSTRFVGVLMYEEMCDE